MKQLEALYDSRKSFYGKALVQQGEGNAKQLFSYGALVAEINGSGELLRVFDDYSQTTLRHIKEFAKQNGFKAETKKQILQDYFE